MVGYLLLAWQSIQPLFGLRSASLSLVIPPLDPGPMSFPSDISRVKLMFGFPLKCGHFQPRQTAVCWLFHHQSSSQNQSGAFNVQSKAFTSGSLRFFSFTPGFTLANQLNPRCHFPIGRFISQLLKHFRHGQLLLGKCGGAHITRQERQ